VAREFRERCQEFMQARGWTRLERMASGRGPHAFLAMQLLAAYAYGRPTQPVSGDPDPAAPPVRVTVVFDDASDRD